MIVAIHQPAFLPWLGYLNRMAEADLFIVLDHVQFERANFQNRTRIRLDGRAHWLTVPVEQHSQLEPINAKLIANSAPEDARHWGRRHCQTLRHAYRDAPFVGDYMPELRRILQARWHRLVDLNHELLAFLRAAFDIHTPLVHSSQLGVTGSRSGLILELCRTVGADAYLAGMGGSRSYLERTAFERAGIELMWQDFQHPRYRQCGEGFLAGLSAFDLLANQGAQGRALLCSQGGTRHALALETT